MLRRRLYLCFLPAFLLSICLETANGDVQQKVQVEAFGKKAAYEDNNVEKVIQQIPFTKDRRRIYYGKTRFRIKHSESRKYVTVTEWFYWSAATPGDSDRFHFTLEKNSFGTRIRTWNAKHHEHVWAYSSIAGGIYFDLDRNEYSDWFGSSYDEKQYWSINKHEPIYDGENVTFTNKYYNDSDLCYYQGWTTSIRCMRTCEDKWVLEVV